VVVPTGWKELEISELCVPQKSRIDPRVSGGGDICVELEHIAGGSGQLLGVTNTSGTSSLKTKFEPGDVLFGKLRAYLRKYWLAEFAGVCSTEIWALSANRTQAVPGFLAQIVRTEDFIEAASLSYGTHMPRSDWAIVSKLIVSVPPLKEQEAIAEALSDADAAIESLDALIAKKRDVKQATMQQLLTGRTRLPGFTADWKEVRLGDLGTCLRGVSYKGDSDLSDGDTPTTVRLLRSNNVQNSMIQFNDLQYVNHDCVSDEQILRRDDIVICMANGSKVLVGKTGLYKGSQDAQYTFGAFMGCFRSSSDQAHAIFIRYLFLTKQYQNYISNLLAGSSINNLTPKSIESLLFNVPPLKEQKAIAETLSAVDDELEALAEQVSKLRMVKEGMMQDLLTGKVRLV
jgi:type I restriction enzyme S subunit